MPQPVLFDSQPSLFQSLVSCLLSQKEEHIFRQLQQTLNADPNNPTHHYNLGLFLWERGEGIDGEESRQYKEKAAEHFLACAKLNPSEGAAFHFLGHYRSQVSVDAQRASKF